MFGIEKLLGIPPEQFDLVFILVISAPLAIFLRSVHDIAHRYMLSLFIGITLQFLLYGKTVFLGLAFTLAVYAMVLILKRKSGWPVFIVSIGALFILHVYNLYDHYGVWDLEFSTSLMVMVCKYTSFAWCYCDGDAKIIKGSLNPQQEANKIVELPSILHYASYIYFFPTAIIGPGHQYAEFRSFIERRDEYASAPEPFQRAGVLVVQALGFALSTLFLLPRYPHTYVLTPEFRQSSIFFKIFYANLCVILLRGRYYVGFKLAQINITLCGIAYGGKKADGTPNWERFFLAKSSAELNYSIKDKVDLWNAAVSTWLRNYVYLRVASDEVAARKPSLGTLRTYATFMTSAVWHGLYPGYYLAFGYWAVLTSASRKLFKIRDRFRVMQHVAFYPLNWLIVNTFFNYGGMPFFLLDFKDSFDYLKQTWLLPLIILLLYVQFGHLVPFLRPPKSNRPAKPVASAKSAPADEVKAGITPGGDAKLD